jgi:hypothetical protein
MPGSAGFAPSDRSSAVDLVQMFSALQSLLLTAQGIDEFLTEVAKLAAGDPEPAAACGITIRRHRTYCDAPPQPASPRTYASRPTTTSWPSA